jgi:hypothetical protein
VPEVNDHGSSKWSAQNRLPSFLDFFLGFVAALAVVASVSFAARAIEGNQTNMRLPTVFDILISHDKNQVAKTMSHARQSMGLSGEIENADPDWPLFEKLTRENNRKRAAEFANFLTFAIEVTRDKRGFDRLLFEYGYSCRAAQGDDVYEGRVTLTCTPNYDPGLFMKLSPTNFRVTCDWRKFICDEETAFLEQVDFNGTEILGDAYRRFRPQRKER